MGLIAELKKTQQSNKLLFDKLVESNAKVDKLNLLLEEINEEEEKVVGIAIEPKNN